MFDFNTLGINPQNTLRSNLNPFGASFGERSINPVADYQAQPAPYAQPKAQVDAQVQATLSAKPKKETGIDEEKIKKFIDA